MAGPSPVTPPAADGPPAFTPRTPDPPAARLLRRAKPLWVFCGQYLNVVLGLLAGIVLVRHLSEAEYGLLSISLTAMFILQDVTGRGLDIPLVRFAGVRRPQGWVAGVPPGCAVPDLFFGAGIADQGVPVFGGPWEVDLLHGIPVALRWFGHGGCLHATAAMALAGNGTAGPIRPTGAASPSREPQRSTWARNTSGNRLWVTSTVRRVTR